MYLIDRFESLCMEFQSKHFSLEYPKDLSHTHNNIHARTCTHTHKQTHTQKQRILTDSFTYYHTYINTCVCIYLHFFSFDGVGGCKPYINILEVRHDKEKMLYENKSELKQKDKIAFGINGKLDESN